MPFLRFRWGAQTAQPARKAIVGSNREYGFLRDQDWICHVPNLKDATYLIRHESGNYEIAWEKHGVTFDAQGNEVATTKDETPDGDLVKPKRAKPKSRR